MAINFIINKSEMGDLNPQREIELNGYLYYVKRLHEVPNLIYECCDLINMQWQRSRTARLRSIEKSSECFPMSLILLKNGEKPKVVGHCKISRLSLSRTKVFIETVVIHPDLRGKGLGKFLMSEAEEICKSKKIEWLYLVTKGQEGFYKKLGYAACPAVSIYSQIDSDEDITEVEEHRKPVSKLVFIDKKINVPPPPPPPPPRPLLFLRSFTNHAPVTKTFMRKKIIFK